MESMHFMPHEVEMACGMSPESARPYWGILDSKGFIAESGEDEYGNSQYALHSPGCDWAVLEDFRSLDHRGVVPLDELIVNLNFAALD
jgi:hypothetical protein